MAAFLLPAAKFVGTNLALAAAPELYRGAKQVLGDLSNQNNTLGNLLKQGRELIGDIKEGSKGFLQTLFRGNPRRADKFIQKFKSNLLSRVPEGFRDDAEEYLDENLTTAQLMAQQQQPYTTQLEVQERLKQIQPPDSQNMNDLGEVLAYDQRPAHYTFGETAAYNTNPYYSSKQMDIEEEEEQDAKNRYGGFQQPIKTLPYDQSENQVFVEQKPGYLKRRSKNKRRSQYY